MRITFVLAAFDMAGGGRVIAIYAEELQRRGHDVCIVGSGPATPTLKQRIKALLRGRILHKGHGGSHFDASPMPVRRLKTNRPVVADDVPDADVIVATWWTTAGWIDRMPASKGRKVHFIQHYEAFNAQMKPGVDSAWRLSMPKITISRWLSAMARDDFDRRDVCLVPNSVDMTQFHAVPRERNRIPTVGMLYHSVKWKGTGIGLQAFEAIRAALPDARLVTFGAFAPLPELPLPSGTRHVRLPPQDQIRDIYALCDVWLCPSVSEGFGLPALEAMACRCPVVAADVGGFRDIIDEGINGFLVPPEDPVALAARAIEILTMSTDEWKTMSDAAWTRATIYSWRDAADAFEAALIRVAQDEPIDGRP